MTKISTGKIGEKSRNLTKKHEKTADFQAKLGLWRPSVSCPNRGDTQANWLDDTLTSRNAAPRIHGSIPLADQTSRQLGVLHSDVTNWCMIFGQPKNSSRCGLIA